ncbi:PEP/pyruvate-binding domain-containing protein [Actinokineospora guangxiensis]|uniref:PEP/pyruvate-binding domain-containing protein n=1 Tax=Actinokineospora guangxiensis TaxID=1490288 RepID=A0ABW0EQD5_9PSEU
MAALIRPGDTRLTDATVVGHKFARQQRLREAGFTVPDFVCVPVSAFDAVAGPRPSTSDDDVLYWARGSKEAIAAAPMPPGLAGDLVSAAEELGGLVAVRACVVADEHGDGEDGATDAFAGLTDSFLYVRPADVPAAVVRCWASARNPESVAYRVRRGLAADSARVAVGVQRMVLGTRSFVAFSRDPRTGAPTGVIAAAHGIGEGVVQERADVDHFTVDGDAVHADVVVKRRMVTRGPDGPFAAEVPADLADAPVLSDDLARQVNDLAAKVAAFFGLPQDIEGTITADGRVHLVQARPIVFAPPEPPRVPWSNHNITESFPGVSGALTYSQAREFYKLAFHDAYRRLGVSERRLADKKHHIDRMIGLLDGRVYYRLDAWFALHGQIPAFPLVRPWWEQSMGLDDAEPPTRADIVRALPSVPGLLVRLAELRGSVRGFLHWWDSLVERADGMDAWSPEELIAFHRGLWAQVGERWGITLMNSVYLLSWATATSALLRRWVGADDKRIIGGLLLGGAENRSVLGVRSAIALAELVAADPVLATRVQDDPADEVWTDIVGGAHGRRVARAAAEHLRRYGDRALHDLKLEEPSPRQRPGMVVEMLRPMVRGGLTVADSRARERAARADAEADLRQRCPSPARRRVIRALAAGLRWFVKTREDTRYCRSQLYGLTRQVLWRLGDHLVEAGRLDERADVVDLTVEEVFGAYDGTLIDSDLRAVVARRRAERLAAASRPDLDARLSTAYDRPVVDGLPARVEAAVGERPAELRGLPSSKGVVRYPARVVLDPSIEPESCRDHIIVAKETDPGWLFLMTAARGMVVERGTLLSHTAITGRLLGIPTVVAVPGATSLIEDGAMIEVDGAAGTVRLLPG